MTPFQPGNRIRDIEGDRYVVVAVNEDGSLDIKPTEGTNPVLKGVPAKFFVLVSE